MSFHMYEDDGIERRLLEKILNEKYNFYKTYKYSNIYLEFVILGYRKADLESKLRESKKYIKSFRLY